jgi:hypothetical protein
MHEDTRKACTHTFTHETPTRTHEPIHSHTHARTFAFTHSPHRSVHSFMQRGGSHDPEGTDGSVLFSAIPDEHSTQAKPIGHGSTSGLRRAASSHKVPHASQANRQLGTHRRSSSVDRGGLLSHHVPSAAQGQWARVAQAQSRGQRGRWGSFVPLYIANCVCVCVFVCECVRAHMHARGDEGGGKKSKPAVVHACTH